MKKNGPQSTDNQKTDHWLRFNWLLQATICIIGLLIVLSTTYGFHRGIQLYRSYVPLLDASMEMRLEATTAYLWFEELLGGDKSKSMDVIFGHLDRAEWYASAMIGGGQNQHLRLLPLVDMSYLPIIERLQIKLQDQRVLLGKRMASKTNAGPGSEIDSEYHATLDDFITDATLFEIEIKKRMAAYFKSFYLLSIFVVAFTILLFAIISFGFYRYESQRKKSYEARERMEQLLIQSEKMASIGTMIAGIAHEINNPNNFIYFNIPILKDYIQEILPILDAHADRRQDAEYFNMSYADFRDDLQNILLNIENGSIRINRLVSDLKSFSKKKDQIQAGWFNIEDTIKSMLAISSSKIRSEVGSFEVHISDDLPTVYCDSDIVELILINFLNNAVEAADKQASWVKLSAYVQKTETTTMIIEVRDNGCGIDERNRERIFEPFYSTKSSQGGTGLGLYMCQSLAEQMGAQITVSSKQDEESRFRLILDKLGSPTNADRTV